MNLVFDYNQEFASASVALSKELKHLRMWREGLRQQLSALSVRRMELQLTRRSLVVVNHQIAQVTEEREGVIRQIDEILARYSSHVRSAFTA
jgi:uncharacterized coiled-coil DUF342 family protein